MVYSIREGGHSRVEVEVTATFLCYSDGQNS
jgi:hypothetical protein